MSTVVTVVLVLVALFAVLGILARTSSRRKKEAQADLEREKAELKTPDILELVRQEAEDAGLDEIPGADEVDLTVRLRVWQRDEHVRSACPDRSKLRFVLASGVSAEAATEDDLRLVCRGVPTPAPADPEAVDADPTDEPDPATHVEGEPTPADDDETAAATDDEPAPEDPSA